MSALDLQKNKYSLCDFGDCPNQTDYVTHLVRFDMSDDKRSNTHVISDTRQKGVYVSKILWVMSPVIHPRTKFKDTEFVVHVKNWKSSFR